MAVKIKLTVGEINQLLVYCKWAEESRTYFGYKPRFIENHQSILKALKSGLIEEGDINNEWIKGGR